MTALLVAPPGSMTQPSGALQWATHEPRILAIGGFDDVVGPAAVAQRAPHDAQHEAALELLRVAGCRAFAGPGRYDRPSSWGRAVVEAVAALAGEAPGRTTCGHRAVVGEVVSAWAGAEVSGPQPLDCGDCREPRYPFSFQCRRCRDYDSHVVVLGQAEVVLVVSLCLHCTWRELLEDPQRLAWNSLV
jgi:hypothetical protein